MRHQLTAYFDNIIVLIILLLSGLTPLLFVNLTTEFFEIPKLTLLLVATTILLGMWIFSWILKGKVVITRTPLDIPLVLLLLVVGVSAYFSPSTYTVIFGSFPRIHGSAVSWAVYVVLYFITVSHLRNLTQIKAFLYILYGSAAVVSILTLLSFFHLYLPFDFAQAANFTPTGSTFSTVALLLLLLPMPLLSVINPNKYMPVPLSLGLATLFGVTVALIGGLLTYFVLLLVFGLCLFVTKPTKLKGGLVMFLIPAIITGVVLALTFLPFPGNGINALSQSFPKEIQLPFNTSWKISASAFRDTPFLGTGPGTYLSNFTAYKPVEFNSYNFWNFSFDSAFNELLQAFATLGLLGLGAFILLAAVVLNASWKNLGSVHHEEDSNTMQVLLPSLAVSGIVSVALLLVHASTVVSIVATFFVLAVLMASQKSVRSKVFEFSLGLRAATSDQRQFDLLPIIFFIIYLVGAVPLLYWTYKAVGADYYHHAALSQANSNGTQTYLNLQKAEQLNPYIDLYRVDMAQTNFALANALAAQKGPSQASSAGSLSDKDKQTIQTLLSQAINEGRAAVALNPRSARNWEVLGSVYRNITGVAQNALAFSLDSYGRAIQLDPLNPALRLSVGGIYYSVKNYDLAIRFFGDAANLKPDYANAYYNLAIALKDKGDIKNAQIAAEQMVKLMQQNPESPDYKRAADFLAGLKAAGATNSASQSAPAAQTNSALNNQSGVTVPGLNNPPQVATPAAVQANPEANVPAPSTIPAASAAAAPSPTPPL